MPFKQRQHFPQRIIAPPEFGVNHRQLKTRLRCDRAIRKRLQQGLIFLRRAGFVSGQFERPPTREVDIGAIDIDERQLAHTAEKSRRLRVAPERHLRLRDFVLRRVRHFPPLGERSPFLIHRQIKHRVEPAQSRLIGPRLRIGAPEFE